MIINHASENWEDITPKNVKILVLGSFNPLNPINRLNTDYYYGRSSNYFWKATADILGKNEDYFCGKLELKKEVMEEYQFCFLDLIKSIKIKCNGEIIDDFVNEKIYKEFTDQVLFTSKTLYKKKYPILVERTYNEKIFDLIKEKNINRIIHTLGNTSIDKDFKTRWKENTLKENGFQGFINCIKTLNNSFDPVSYSPSGRAVRIEGHDYYNELKGWIKINLNL